MTEIKTQIEFDFEQPLSLIHIFDFVGFKLKINSYAIRMINL